MSKLGKVLLFVCLLDLAITVWVVSLDFVGENNPILKYYLQKWGVPGLVASKVWLVLLPIFVLEVGSRGCPYARKRIGQYYLTTIVLYVGLLASWSIAAFV